MIIYYVDFRLLLFSNLIVALLKRFTINSTIRSENLLIFELITLLLFPQAGERVMKSKIEFLEFLGVVGTHQI